MFEKSLYDLIKGLRTHKGAENEYIQDSLRECSVEIKSRDMDKKATALLKLIYLEMFGYDMSWASFYVLEVMSSTKYLQKRVGYLAAVQSFSQDTEVLMLATNLLKKDVANSGITHMSLPLTALPHITTPSLAMSLYMEIASRISHSHAIIRKKAVVSLYRLALAYPEALKLAWPKIKDRLMDDQEDSSVTTAVVNVVCELGWRRPQDLLPLAPRLFDLLVDGGNNWMAIKIIKLFATLTPMEPRLVKKLLRPLATIIQTTSAMSLLYECINGIVQGGVLGGDDTLREKDEIAYLCVGKLRGMIVTEADPNLKYVGLLAFNRIADSHPGIVSTQQDVIMDCLEDADISIRFLALDLSVKLIDSNTLQALVDRLISQLHGSLLSAPGDAPMDAESLKPLGPTGASKYGGPEKQGDAESYEQEPPLSLPVDYRIEVLHRILDVCSYNNYTELPDFEWYVNVLVQLVRLLPSDATGHALRSAAYQDPTLAVREDIASRIGLEIRNIAVRVRNIRMKATRVAESLVLVDNRGAWLPIVSNTNSGILGPLAWVVGEYAEYLLYPSRTLESLIDMPNVSLPARTLSLYIQAIPKVFMHLAYGGQSWDLTRQSETSLILARVIEFLEALAAHPDLDVQERAIEFLEILRLAAEAVQSGTYEPGERPFLISSVIPSLFSGLELNPVAASAQRKVPLPEKLSLEKSLVGDLPGLFNEGSDSPRDLGHQDPVKSFYYVRDLPVPDKPLPEILQIDTEQRESYQNPGGLVGDMAGAARRNAERAERNKDDPFYIGTEERSSGKSTPLHPDVNIWHGEEINIDAIPVIDLRMDDQGSPVGRESQRKHRSRSKKYDVVADETIGYEEASGTPTAPRAPDKLGKSKSSLLQVDSSGLGHFPLEEASKADASRNPTSMDRDEEMARAMREVEKARLEMQRASERIHSGGVPSEGMLVSRKKKKKKKKGEKAAHSETEGAADPAGTG